MGNDMKQSPENEVVDDEGMPIPESKINGETDVEVGSQDGVEGADDAELKAPADELETAKAEAARYLEGWQRERAELENFKKRTERERSQWETTLRADFVTSILPALDDFDLVLANQPEGIDSEWVNAVRMVHKKMMDRLEAIGVKEIAASGEPFDPAFHEAVAQVESEEHEPGMVADVLRKGYKLNDRILRPSLVRVAQ